MAKSRLPSNWRDRIEIVIDDHEDDEWLDCITLTMLFKKGKTPKGFFREIGHLEIESGSNLVDSAELHSRLRRRGLGTMLYEAALEHLGELSTYYHNSSDEAQALWQSLCRHHRHKIDFFTPKLTIFSRKRRCK